MEEPGQVVRGCAQTPRRGNNQAWSLYSRSHCGIQYNEPIDSGPVEVGGVGREWKDDQRVYSYKMRAECFSPDQGTAGQEFYTEVMEATL